METKMTLPALDVAYLSENGISHEIVSDGGMICVVIPDFPLPVGLNLASSDLLLRLSPGYPDVTPDMWWFGTSVTYKDGRTIPQTESMEPYLGRTWQRWSRHFDQGRWKPGLDCLESFLAVIRSDLNKYAAVAA
jgi:hypothetical protein